MPPALFNNCLAPVISTKIFSTHCSRN
jgi:hypothetical protein